MLKNYFFIYTYITLKFQWKSSKDVTLNLTTSKIKNKNICSKTQPLLTTSNWTQICISYEQTSYPISNFIFPKIPSRLKQSQIS